MSENAVRARTAEIEEALYFKPYLDWMFAKDHEGVIRSPDKPSEDDQRNNTVSYNRPPSLLKEALDFTATIEGPPYEIPITRPRSEVARILLCGTSLRFHSIPVALLREFLEGNRLGFVHLVDSLGPFTHLR